MIDQRDLKQEFAALIRDALPIGGTPEEAADKILALVREHETARVCRLLGVSREGVVRAWIGDDGRVCVLPRAYAQHVTIDVGFAAPQAERGGA